MMSIFNSLVPTAALILGFGFIIFVHELGHFMVAKWVGIHVTQFAIGFGQSLLTWRKGLGIRVGTTEPEYVRRVAAKMAEMGHPVDPSAEFDPSAEPAERARESLGLGETEYRLNWMPLGGYVKMVGQEDMDPSASSGSPRAFNRKPIWARACVISAGVIMNLITGVIFFVIAFRAGVEFPPAMVGAVFPDAPAATAYPAEHPTDPDYRGLKPGDRITHLNNRPVSDMMDVATRVALSPPGEPIHLTIGRPLDTGNEERLSYAIVPRAGEETERLLSIGISSPTSLTVARFTGKDGDRMPARLEAAGIKPGMRLTAVNDKPVQRFDQFDAAVTGARGLPVKLTFQNVDRDGIPELEGTAHIEVTADPALIAEPTEGLRHIAGLVPGTRIMGVVPGSPAQRAGAQAGDVVTRLGPDGSWEDWPAIEQVSRIVTQAADADRSAPEASQLRLSVLRNDRTIELATVTPENRMLGILMGRATHLPVVSRTLPGMALSDLQLTAGSRIVSLNEHPVHSFSDIQRQLTALAQSQPEGFTVHVGYTLNVAGLPQSVTKVDFSADAARALAEARWTIPAEFGSSGMLVFERMSTPLKADTAIEAISLGIVKTHQFMAQVYVTLARLFQGTVKPSHLRGPVGIIHEGSRVAQRGWTYLMFFLGLISVNLVVINFLPIPIVDGGLMVFLIIEKIKGSPVSARIQTAAMLVGIILIASIFLVTTFYDISRLEFIRRFFTG